MFSGLEFKFKVTFFTNRPAPAGNSLSFLPSVLSERKDPVYGGCDDNPDSDKNSRYGRTNGGKIIRVVEVKEIMKKCVSIC